MTVLARGTHLSVDGQNNGYMVVFDDISEVISANRSVAWGEVARRLAHEIKNPLTPIQLSAERLLMKLAHKLEPADAQLLERSTTTIVNQVTSLKHMVDDFKEYARKPTAALLPIDLNALVDDVLTLYGWEPDAAASDAQSLPWRLEVSLAPNLPLIEGDSTQLRQVIHNLLANARDALTDAPQADAAIMVSTQLADATQQDGSSIQSVRFTVMDSGPGFPAHVLQRVFEPYVTTKAQGTGLGLAIVRKIIEEHGGRIDVSNRRDGGARISMLFTRLVARVELHK